LSANEPFAPPYAVTGEDLQEAVIGCS
jgi:hypothetical protein